MGKAVRTAFDGFCLLLVPVTLAACAALRLQSSALMTLMVAVIALGLFFAGWERSKPGLRQILPTAVLTAAAVVGRIIFAAAPNIQPVTALCVIAGATFGRRVGFMTGAMTGLVSSFFLGLGAWTPWQMYAWGLVGYVAGMAFCGKGSKERDKGSDPLPHPSFGTNNGSSASLAAVLAFGFLASFAFGFIMNTWTLVGFANAANWGSAAAVYGAGFVFDVAHAVSTAVFLFLLYSPLKTRLQRISTKYALAESSNTVNRP